uniref:Uncharacterized protein n=1 Tax=Leersia perrieri TaxID=77586 RepID=A0A0D9XD83_9ORYZ
MATGVGQIPQVETLRSVLFSVSRSLERLGEAPPTKSFWTRRYLTKLQRSLDIGWQSLSLMERTFSRLEANLVDKAEYLAFVAKQDYSPNEVVTMKKEDDKRRANRTLALCRNFNGLCRANVNALDAMDRAIKDRLANVPGAGENLQETTRVASEAMGMLAGQLRPTVLMINAVEDIPSILENALEFCPYKILSIKTCADSPFLILGCGAFSFRRRLNSLQEKMTCAAHNGYMRLKE